jgi:hypothetical protein
MKREQPSTMNLGEIDGVWEEKQATFKTRGWGGVAWVGE